MIVADIYRTTRRTTRPAGSRGGVLDGGRDQPLRRQGSALRAGMKRVTGALIASVLGFTTGGAFADGDAARGEKKFEDCAACHKLERGENSLGPSLYGVFGRPAATLTDFRYFAGAEAQRHHLVAAGGRRLHRRSAGGGAGLPHALRRHDRRRRPRRPDRVFATGVQIVGRYCALPWRGLCPTTPSCPRTRKAAQESHSGQKRAGPWHY